MQSAYETFRCWMMAHASNDEARKLVDGNLYEIRWFFDIAETGRHRLARVEDLDLPRVVQSIRLATNCPVRSVLPISMSKPFFAKPEWMPESVYRQSLRGSYGNGLFDLLHERYQFERWVRSPFGDVLTKAFVDTLRTLEKGSPWNRYWEEMRALLGPALDGDGCWYALRLFCEALLSGNRLAMEDLSPLVSKTLRCTRPLGQKLDEPEAFLVLTA